MFTNPLVCSVLEDPVAFELVLRQLACPNDGLVYANDLVNIWRDIKTMNGNFDSDVIKNQMEELEVAIDHAGVRFARLAIFWLEAALQLTWDSYSRRYNRPFVNLYNDRYFRARNNVR
jgi:hypothetical protein